MYLVLSLLLLNLCDLASNDKDEPLNSTQVALPTSNETTDFYNETSSEVPYENVTDVVNITDTTPVAFTPTKEVFHSFNLSSSVASDKYFTTCEECFCDLTPDLCDMNCCCDKSCRKEDIQVFSACDDLIFPISRKFCFRHNIFSHINIEYEIEKIPDRLYCALPAISKQQKCFIEHKPLNSEEEQQLLSKNRRFSPLPSKTDEYCGFTIMKVGDPVFIHILANREYQYLGIPDASSRICDNMQIAKYMLNKTTSCHTVLSSNACEKLGILNGNTFHTGLQVIGRLRIQPYVCDFSLECNPVDNFNNPHFDESSNECQNVVNHLQYLFIHDGIKGIKEVKLNIVLTNVTLKAESDDEILQSFSIDFIGINNSLEIRDYIGYQQGDSILINSCNETDSLLTTENLRVLGADATNECTKTEPVLFGVNIVSSCFLNVPQIDGSCNLESVNISFYENITVSFIGKFKNVEPFDLDGWISVPFVTEKSNTEIFKTRFQINCEYVKNIKVSNHVIIFYSLIGHKSNPQAKIVGAINKSTRGGYAFMNSELQICSIQFSSTVTFIDVTEDENHKI